MHVCLYKKALRFLSAAIYWTVAAVGFVNYSSIVLERRHRNNFFFCILFLLSQNEVHWPQVKLSKLFGNKFFS